MGGEGEGRTEKDVFRFSVAVVVVRLAFPLSGLSAWDNCYYPKQSNDILHGQRVSCRELIT